MGTIFPLKIVLTSAKILELLRITNNHAESNEVYKLQINLDDNINRSMRANLIFKGIPKDEAFNSYKETKTVVSTFIKANLNIDEKSISDMIVRAHRNKGRPTQNGHPHNIFVKFARDDFTLKLHEDFTDIARRDTNVKYKCSQQLTSSLMERRNKAMLERKSLLQANTIKKGFVEYPATLQVMLAEF